MTKIMSKTIEKISYLFIFIISLFLIIYFFLLHGFTINSLTLPRINIKRLYIRLDKKLIVKIDYLKIKKNYTKTNVSEQILNIKNYLKYFNATFKEIDIEKIAYNNEILSLKYKKNLFFLETNQLYVLSTISLSNQNLFMINIKKLYLKQYQTFLSGYLKINIQNNIYSYDGVFITHNINGKIKLTLKNNILQYYIYNVKSNNIAPFMDYLNSKIKINKIISNWIYKYITAKDYHLQYLFGRIDLKTGKFYPKYMQGEATIKNVAVKFHKNLPPVKIKNIKINLKNNTLSFNLNNPKYEGINLKGSSVKITNLLTKGAYIDIVIKTKHFLDQKIKNILQNYHINIPIIQKGSKTKAILKITIPFVPFSINTDGNFTTDNSSIIFKGIRFYTKHTDIVLHNNIIKLKNTNLSYKNIFDINSTGILDTKKDIFVGYVNINKLLIKYKNFVLLKTKSQKSKIKIDLKNNKIILSTLKTNLIFKPKQKSFIFQNLSNIYPISPFLKKYDINKGNAIISTKEFKKYNIKSKIIKKQKIIKKNNQFIKYFNFSATINKDNISLSTDDKSIKISISKNIKLKTKDISFVLNNLKNKSSINIKLPIMVNANNSTIFLSDNLRIPTNKFTFISDKNKKIFSSIYQDNRISYNKDFNATTIRTNFISSEYLNKLINYNLFYGGKFKFNIEEKNGIMRGVCYILNSIIKSAKKEGEDFKIDIGKIYFSIQKNILTFNNIELKNNFLTLKGKGYINLKNKKIELNFDITMLKQLGKTIKSIPFLGYMLLGKNGKFSSKATISGNLNNPVIKTNLTTDVIKTPFNIIFRIIKTPYNIISNQKSIP